MIFAYFGGVYPWEAAKGRIKSPLKMPFPVKKSALPAPVLDKLITFETRKEKLRAEANGL